MPPEGESSGVSMSAAQRVIHCPQCGRPDLRTLTWRELGIAETTLGCWDCSWITFPPGVTADNWSQKMSDHQAAKSVTASSEAGRTGLLGLGLGLELAARED
jgi:hypothetical protein